MRNCIVIMTIIVLLTIPLYSESSASQITFQKSLHDNVGFVSSYNYIDSFAITPFEKRHGSLNSLTISYMLNYAFGIDASSRGHIQEQVVYNIEMNGPLNLNYTGTEFLYPYMVDDDMTYYSLYIYNNVYDSTVISGSRMTDYIIPNITKVDFNFLITAKSTETYGSNYFNIDYYYTYDYTPIPEPSAFILLGAGLGGLTLARRKARK